MSPAKRVLSCVLAGWLLTITAGCATMNLSKIDFRSRKATARNPVVNIVCLWEPCEGKDPKGLPCPAFAGRIMFMNRDSLSVSVDGDVRIYQFDNMGTVEEQCKPIHQFNFDSEPWQQHYMYGTVGPCYNVVIPYMRKGTTASTCSLRLRFTPKDGGPPVFSELTPIEVHAFGSSASKKPLIKSTVTDPRVEQTTPEDLTTVNKRRRTTTIALDSKGGAVSESTVSPETTAAPQVQQASYRPDEEPRPLTESDAKIAQLEKMVRELQAMQGTAPPAKAPAAKPPAAAPSASSAPPRLLEEEATPPAAANPTRIKVRAIESPSAEQPAARRVDSIDDSHTARTERSEPRRHPLDDDSAVGAVKSSKAPAKRVRHEPTFEEAEPSKPARRHPLDDDDDTPAKPAARRAARAAEVAPQSDSEPSRSSNPFDPIETDQAETQAVRVRLRAVNE